jgi:hypothetical protein
MPIAHQRRLAGRCRNNPGRTTPVTHIFVIDVRPAEMDTNFENRLLSIREASQLMEPHLQSYSPVARLQLARTVRGRCPKTGVKESSTHPSKVVRPLFESENLHVIALADSISLFASMLGFPNRRLK